MVVWHPVAAVSLALYFLVEAVDAASLELTCFDSVSAAARCVVPHGAPAPLSCASC